MKFQSNAMSADIHNDTIAVFLCMTVDRIRHIPQKCPRFYRLDALFHALLCNPHELFLIRRRLSDDKHSRRIGEISFVNRRNIDVNDITLF